VRSFAEVDCKGKGERETRPKFEMLITKGCGEMRILSYVRDERRDRQTERERERGGGRREEGEMAAMDGKK